MTLVLRGGGWAWRINLQLLSLLQMFIPVDKVVSFLLNCSRVDPGVLPLLGRILHTQGPYQLDRLIVFVPCASTAWWRSVRFWRAGAQLAAGLHPGRQGQGQGQWQWLAGETYGEWETAHECGDRRESMHPLLCSVWNASACFWIYAGLGMPSGRVPRLGFCACTPAR